jgi:hypothetical protein
MDNSSNYPKGATPQTEDGKTPSLSLPEQNFQLVPNLLVNDVARKLLKPGDVVVYIALLNHLGKNDCVWATRSRIGALTGYSVKNVGRCIDRLVFAGHVRRKGRTSYGAVKLALLTRVKDSQVITTAYTIEKTPKSLN